MKMTAAETYNQNNYADLEKRIGSLTASALPHYRSISKQLARLNPKNAQMVCDFMATDYNEQNVLKAHQIDPHQGYLLLHQVFEIQGFRQIGKADVLLYPNNLRKQDSVDPSPKWIGDVIQGK